MANHRKEFDLDSLPRSRADAILCNSSHFYTGEPCRYGHFRPRITSNSRCLDCNTESNRRSQKRPESRMLRKEVMKRYRKTPNGKSVYKKHHTAYRISKLNAFPPWGSKSQIDDFILSCPEGYHVDHILPLKGKSVCGLHVLENLQYLPARENMQKSNRIVPITLEACVCPLRLCAGS